MAIGGFVGGTAALAARRAGHQLVGRGNFHHGQGGIEQADVDHLALAGAVAVAQGGKRADGGVQRGVAVDHGGCDAQWLADGLAGERHEAGHGLAERVEGGSFGVRTVTGRSRRPR